MTKSINTKFSRPLLLLIFFILCCCLSGCGGSKDTANPTTPTTPTAASMDLLVSSSTLNSSGTQSVTLTALVKDSSNVTLTDQTVSFSSDYGAISVVSNTTDASGQATATLTTGGDKTNRTITITANCGAITTTNTVDVIGTTIDISGQDSVGQGTSATYTITLKDSASVGIKSKTVTLTHTLTSNTFSPTTFTTGDSGTNTVPVTLTAGTTAGTDTLTATALGAVGQKTVTINGAGQNLAFTTPAANTEIYISTLTPVTISYFISGSPVPDGTTVLFATSRGTLDNHSATTLSGYATVNISSQTVGATTITASVSGGPSASLNVEFVAKTPSSMTLQADPSIIYANTGTSTTQRSTLIATVRDTNNNLVKNKTVNFALTHDDSVGYLSAATATTDSSGKASVSYIAGTNSGATDGVTITAAIPSTSVSATTSLTVAGTALFITIGTGPKIVIYDTSTYQKDFDIVVADSGGNPVPGVTATVTATSIAYMKGYYIADTAHSLWVQVPTLAFSHDTTSTGSYADPIIGDVKFCLNEDMYYWNDPSNTSYLLNGSLDPGEDYNSSGYLEPKSVATITSPVTTNSNGVGTVSVYYLKQYSTWVYVRLDVTVNVGATEGTAHTTFLLPNAVSDYPYPTQMPPDSPFGYSTTCADTN